MYTFLIMRARNIEPTQSPTRETHVRSVGHLRESKVEQALEGTTMDAKEKLQLLQKNCSNIRNICILAHVDHGM